MKIDIEKLIAVLTELGVEEEKIDAAVSALTEEEAPVDPEGKSEEEITSSETPSEEEVASGEPEEVVEEVEVEPSQEEVPADAESVPLPPEEPQPMPPVEEVPVEEEAPVEEGVVPGLEEPQGVSLEEFIQVKTELEEQKKANEGLSARISSLEEALKSAGVIDGSVDSSVGFDDPTAPGRNVVDTTMDDVLREINHKGY